ncbi:putative terpene cyclase [Heterobasidion irregulare TC 32-1]|uniref:Putative terpene cyclase n=1 Tax=Heterobasidion irregulare (strain TC 32-1) TaxID=747525 RepID=W4K546_HETIT|nr:putative terpene cyclase [Heterobasidion irregulare TC 32-1]ETW80864.1 putative terpene cyclase [Heterobasidion irregulare TC 32-1]
MTMHTTLEKDEISASDLNAITSIFKTFLRDIDYKPQAIQDTNVQLEEAMYNEMHNLGICCDQLERTLHLAASYVEIIYQDCNLAEKIIIAKFTWYMIYIDDMVSKDPTPVVAFQERFLRRQPQLDPVLDAAAEVFMRIYQYYDAYAANCIITSALEFLTFFSVEAKIQEFPLVRKAHRFPWFLRERTGVAEGFAFLMFPKRLGVDIMEYIQAMPDMVIWIDLANDLLSFYKEEHAGDSANYIHTRAFVEEKAPIQVLDEVANDLHSSASSILATITQCPKAIRAWRFCQYGYVHWHLSQDRYKLKDLGL